MSRALHATFGEGGELARGYDFVRLVTALPRGTGLGEAGKIYHEVVKVRSINEVEVG